MHSIMELTRGARHLIIRLQFAIKSSNVCVNWWRYPFTVSRRMDLSMNVRQCHDIIMYLYSIQTTFTLERWFPWSRWVSTKCWSTTLETSLPPKTEGGKKNGRWEVSLIADLNSTPTNTSQKSMIVLLMFWCGHFVVCIDRTICQKILPRHS